jgi:acyl-CoA thioesterase-1
MRNKLHHLSLSLVCLFVLWSGNFGQLSGQFKTSRAVQIFQSADEKSVSYLALGDSTCVGLGAQKGYGYVERLLGRIRRRYPASQQLKLCGLGNTTTVVLQRLSSGVDIHPTIVTVSVGINDLLERVNEQEFARNYNEIIKYIQKLGATIIVVNLPDVSLAPGLPEAMRVDLRARVIIFNKQIAAIARRHSLPVIDLYGACNREIPFHPEFFSSDGFHPSDAGYEFWTETMWPIVESALGLQRESKK